jgi:hypothetical protein
MHQYCKTFCNAYIDNLTGISNRNCLSLSGKICKLNLKKKTNKLYLRENK